MQRQSHSSTVFSLPITVSVAPQYGGIPASFTASEIISLSYVANSPDIGFSGVATTSVNVTVANKTSGVPACQKGDKILITGDGSFPAFFVDSRTFDTNTTTFTAYDSCSKLEVDFDTANFPNIDNNGNVKLYSQSQVFSAMSHQLDMTIGAPSDLGIQFGTSDLQGSCRSILEAVSEINGVMFVCSSDNGIQPVSFKEFVGLTNIRNFQEVISDSRSTIEFSGLVVRDTTCNKEYTYGSNNVFKIIESSLVKGDTNIGGALYSRFRTVKYTGFIMNNATTYMFTPVIPQQINWNIEKADGTTISGSAFVLNISAVYTSEGWLIQYSSPEAEPAAVAYVSKDARELKEKVVKQDEKQGVYFLNKNGSGMRVKLDDGN